MARVVKGRHSADTGDLDEFVVFLIGMRINRLSQVWRWLPVFKAMPRMLTELGDDPSLGLLGRPRVFLSGRVIQVQQYWRSFEDLDRYARSATHAHLPAWRNFNRVIRDNGTVGVFHETYRVGPGRVEAVYANMPVFGLAAATSHVPADRVGQTAATRIGVRPADAPPVAPY